MDKNVVSDIPLVEKNWWPPDFNNLTILRLPLLSEKTAVDKSVWIKACQKSLLLLCMAMENNKNLRKKTKLDKN